MARPRVGVKPPPPPLEQRLPPAPPGHERASHAYVPTIPEISAVQAMVRGEATADQQLRLLDLVINKLAATYDLSYRPGPGGDRETAFAEGRRLVGLQLVTMTKVDVAELERRERAAKNPPAR
jgi:hypothetical protein